MCKSLSLIVAALSYLGKEESTNQGDNLGRWLLDNTDCTSFVEIILRLRLPARLKWNSLMRNAPMGNRKIIAEQ